MKKVKAYIRPPKVEDVVRGLAEIGVEGVSLIDVMGIGSLADPEESSYTLRASARYAKLTKLEVVCKEAEVERVVATIRQKAYTGLKGDGIILVSPLAKVIHIRTGVTET
ncbi:MAG TPA: P-II family nitrogen regulator [Bacteroidetes bacterium]|nr:P-II family nitrogen regulator [Bacteroidota bacterium]